MRTTCSVALLLALACGGGPREEVTGSDGAANEACEVPADCASGFCIDGVCCDRACEGSCERCDLAGQEGTCTATPQACSGDCSECVSTGERHDCVPNQDLCSGDCAVCTGNGAEYSCAAADDLCADCEACVAEDSSFACTSDKTRCFSLGFSSTQGAHQWSYKYFDGSDYHDMSWQSDHGGSWRGSGPLCLIGPGWVHPDQDCEPVIAWESPLNGSVSVKGVMDRYDVGGDGVSTRIAKNSTQIWPTAGQQTLRPRVVAQHLTTVDVAPGDVLYFHTHHNEDSTFDTTEWDPVIRPGHRPVLTLDRLERVVSPSEFPDFFVDASLSVVGVSGDNHWFHSFGSAVTAGKHRKSSGPLSAPFADVLFEKTNAEFFDNPNGLDEAWGWWISNIYEIAPDELLAFCHLEQVGDEGVLYRVGLAYSDDGGSTFAKLGYIVVQDLEQSQIDSNIQGVPFVVSGAHIYIYFNDFSGGQVYAAVARADLDAVIAAARDRQVVEWKKYYQNGWTESGLGGQSSALLSNWPLAPCPPKTHGDAAYSAALGKFVLSANVEWCEHRGIWLSIADDPVSFGEPIWIQNLSKRQEALAQYVSIVDASSSDNGLVGQEFFLYWGYAPRWQEDAMQSLKHVYRQRVTLLP